VNEELESIVVSAFGDLVDRFEDSGAPNLRSAAYAVAIDRVLDAYEQGGNWP